MVVSELNIPNCFEMVNGKITPTERGKEMANTYSAYILKLLNETRQYARTQIKMAFFNRWLGCGEGGIYH